MNILQTFFRAGWLLLLLACAGAAQAQVSAATAEQLLRKSGLWQQLESMGPQMRDSLDQGLKEAGDEIQPATRQRLMAAADTAFAAERMRASALRVVSAGTRQPYVAPLLGWFDSPAGRRIALAEEAAAKDATEPTVQAQRGMELLNAAAPARRELMAQVVEASRAARSLTDIVINIAVAVRGAILAAEPAAKGPTAAALRAELEAQRPQLLEAFRGFAWASFAVVYQQLPDDDLRAYVQLMGTSAGEHFNDVGESAIETAMLDAIGALGKPRP
jgi:hypothetical protein